MKCQILFSGKNKEKQNTNLSSAEFAQRVVRLRYIYLYYSALVMFHFVV